MAEFERVLCWMVMNASCAVIETMRARLDVKFFGAAVALEKSLWEVRA